MEYSTRMDWDICCICQNQSSTPLQKSANAKKLEDAGAGYRTLAENLFAFRENQCTDLPPFAEEHCSVNEIQQLLVQNEACWHKSCYLKYNRNMLKRFLNRKQALENEPEEKKRKFTRSIADTSNNCQECFFCEKAGQEKLHEASTFRINRRVRECAGLLKDDKLLAKLSVGDMVALEVKYHQTCLVRLHNRARKLKREENKESSNNSSDSIDHGVALAELIAYLY